ncbi:MAG: thioredoxin domain-containing protein [Chthoniobacterales bacterium]|nr:thioredoxin domain-containing protein [Chthoniobacterales bacterium]
MRRFLPYAIIAVVLLGTATAGTLVYRAKHARVLEASARTAADNVGGKAGAVPAHAHGPDNAAVTIEEFADFQCPPCAAVAGLVYNLDKDFPGKLRLVFRQYPLDMHKNARLAALGAEAAGLQGKFWDMHKQLFLKQQEWSKADDFRSVLDNYAKQIGLAVDRFGKDLDSEKVVSRLKQDRERATSLGVTSTPTLFINGQAVPAEARTPDGFRAAIQKAIDGKKAP